MRLYTDHFAFGARHTAVESGGFARNHNHGNESAQKSPGVARGTTCMNTRFVYGRKRETHDETLPHYCHDYCPSESAPDDRGKMDDSPRSRSTRAARAHPHRTGY